MPTTSASVRRHQCSIFTTIWPLLVQPQRNWSHSFSPPNHWPLLWQLSCNKGQSSTSALHVGMMSLSRCSVMGHAVRAIGSAGAWTHCSCVKQLLPGTAPCAMPLRSVSPSGQIIRTVFIVARGLRDCSLQCGWSFASWSHAMHTPCGQFWWLFIFNVWHTCESTRGLGGRVLCETLSSIVQWRDVGTLAHQTHQFVLPAANFCSSGIDHNYTVSQERLFFFSIFLHHNSLIIPVTKAPIRPMYQNSACSTLWTAQGCSKCRYSEKEKRCRAPQNLTAPLIGINELAVGFWRGSAYLCHTQIST